MNAVETIPVSDEYLLRVWEVDAGLPHNTIFGIAQTPDGYLWLGTPGGLVRFDGVRFTTFSKNETPGIESNYVRAVFATREGDLWIGLDRGGVARRHGDRFEVIVPLAPRTAITSWTSSFAQDASGAIWFGRAPESEVFRWKDGALETFTTKEGVGRGRDTFVHVDESGILWFATKAECGIFDGERFRAVDPTGGENVRLSAARGGGMWATRGDQVVRYRTYANRDTLANLTWLKDLTDSSIRTIAVDSAGANLQPTESTRSVASSEVNVLFEDSVGNLWIGTRSAGLFRFREGRFVRVPTSSNGILTIMEDREGNLWVGTSGGGLNRIRSTQFFLKQSRHGLGRDSVSSMCGDTEGRLWLAVQDGLPVRALESGNKTFAVPSGWPAAPVTVLCSDPGGGVWIGCDAAMLFRWKNGTFEKVNLPGGRVRSLLVDRHGELWIATARSGLFHWREGSIDEIPTEGGLVVARALAEDAAGRLWVGTEEGLVFQRQQDGRFVRVALPAAKAGESIRFIVADKEDTVWIGALDGGLYRWRAGTILRLPLDVGIPMDDLRSLLIANDGDFWIGTGRGLFRVTRDQIESVLSRQTSVFNAEAYGRNEGVRSMEFVFGNRNATAKTGDGHLWFATSRGALEIEPEITRKNAPPVPVLIEEMRVDGEAVRTGREPTDFPANTETVEIRYTLPNGSAPERVQFRYRLEGFSGGWISSGMQRAATFSRLPPGNYRFQVEASMDGSSWLSGGAWMDFKIRAAWWETKWFQALVILLFALGIATLVRVIVLRRVRARMRRLEQESALERERARIARDMHDELGASLTRIALMSDLAAFEPESGGATGQRFAEIATAARAVAGTLDEIVWTVNPRNDTLERLIGYLGEFATEYMETAGVILKLELPSELPPLSVSSDVRHEILLSVKEALNNVVKYASATEVTMQITFEKGDLCIKIADNGQGFDPAIVSTSANGLHNMQQRLASLDGSAQIESQTGEGTRVTFSLSLGGKHHVGRMCDMTNPGAARLSVGAHPAARDPKAF